LRKKIADDSMQERGQIKQTHRYYSTTHSMKPVEEILTGKYLRSETRSNPPKELSESIGMPVPPALLTSKEQEEVERG
jgi:NAD(P)H-quinone oxidoreductase subunit K